MIETDDSVRYFGDIAIQLVTKMAMSHAIVEKVHHGPGNANDASRMRREHRAARISTGINTLNLVKTQIVRLANDGLTKKKHAFLFKNKPMNVVPTNIMILNQDHVLQITVLLRKLGLINPMAALKSKIQVILVLKASKSLTQPALNSAQDNIMILNEREIGKVKSSFANVHPELFGMIGECIVNPHQLHIILLRLKYQIVVPTIAGMNCYAFARRIVKSR